MYSQDGMGLGHLRRSSNIANEILLRDPECNIMILADSPAVSLFSSQERIEFLKLPTVIKTGSTSWKNGSLSLAIERILRLRAKIILDAFWEFEPDALLIDHMPVGVRGELKPLLELATRRRPRPQIFLGLRDILDDPGVIRRVWSQLGAYDHLRHYDAVLIYGSREIYDATAAYRLAHGAREIIYCDYVAPRIEPLVPDRTPDDPFILMMGGGGLDAYPVGQAFMQALPMVVRELDVAAVLLTGPNMSATDREALRARAPAYLRIETGLENASEWIRRASAVVTMGGYNSLCEVLKWRKKTLVVPRPGPSAEQQIRSQLFSTRSLIRVCPPVATPAQLAEKLLRLLTEDGIPNAANIPALNGAQRTAAALLGWPRTLEETPITTGRRVHAASRHAALASGWLLGSPEVL
jgi:predicted glycosyltransferase